MALSNNFQRNNETSLQSEWKSLVQFCRTCASINLITYRSCTSLQHKKYVSATRLVPELCKSQSIQQVQQRKAWGVPQTFKSWCCRKVIAFIDLGSMTNDGDVFPCHYFSDVLLLQCSTFKIQTSLEILYSLTQNMKD